MDHYSHVLENVTVSGENSNTTQQPVDVINEKLIAENANLDLSNMLGKLTGVSVLRTGTSISRPVVHGLYGNRLLILNNGLPQAGQQWGNDHSPEIDPLVANKITVIKGTSSLEYAGSSLGSVVMVEPERIRKEPHLHGRASYFFETNGLGHGTNIKLQRHTDKIGWKINATLKASGDKRAADYYLNNTGSREANLAVQLEKSFTDDWMGSVYFSSFNTKIGVLRGSHIGNLTDLESALNQDRPFYTEEKFSYEIDAPSQTVNHQLLKLQSKHFISDNQWVEFTYGGQLNRRKEFDVRRQGFADKPALSLLQFSHFISIKHQWESANKLTLKSALQSNSIFNTNNPETDVLPLIPDYFSFENGAFVSLSKTWDHWSGEIGGRYDFITRNVATISSTVPREIIRYEDNFHNYSFLAGLGFSPNETIRFSLNTGYATRNPAINELYSSGLHQGVSGIEQGDVNLQKEKSLKTTLAVDGRIKDKFFFEILGYTQSIKDYIFLNPTGEVALTIRGAFPVFQYEQTNALISGTDISARYEITKKTSISGKYSFIKGLDLTNDQSLIFIPSNNISGTLSHNIPKWGKLNNIEIALNHQYVFEQKNILIEQDFIPAPPGYHLTGFKLGAETMIKNNRLNIYIKGDNIFNVSYRDYLDRQRYFADGMGINIMLGAALRF